MDDVDLAGVGRPQRVEDGEVRVVLAQERLGRHRGVGPGELVGPPVAAAEDLGLGAVAAGRREEEDPVPPRAQAVGQAADEGLEPAEVGLGDRVAAGREQGDRQPATGPRDGQGR